MTTKEPTDWPLSDPPDAPASPDGCILLDEIDSPILLQGIAYWDGLRGERRFPSRGDVTPRGLKRLLRNTTLLRVVDGGADYEYRIVGDAHVMAHGESFQGKRWSEIGTVSPGYQAMVKPIYDHVVGKGVPLATRGWIERSIGSEERTYCEKVFLPLGTEEAGVDHILVFSVYVPRAALEKSSVQA